MGAHRTLDHRRCLWIGGLLGVLLLVTTSNSFVAGWSARTKGQPAAPEESQAHHYRSWIEPEATRHAVSPATWTSVFGIAAAFGILAAMMPISARAEDQKILDELAKIESQASTLSPKDRARVLQYTNEPPPQPLLPRQSVDKENMSENERMKEERLARQRAMMASVPVEDGWRMKLWGLPDSGPSKKKKKSGAKAPSVSTDAAEASGEP
mmetsp:Transcript_44959/g.103949  ORF Transcript_44959/g.103949 Transcript_44959/m.103949 type:complete len:210 (+) Transcript_44959:36-665(+)